MSPARAPPTRSQWQALLVFPGEFVEVRRVASAVPAVAGQTESARRRLFVLPVLSLNPGQVPGCRVRRSAHAHHFCPDEVAAQCLALAGESHARETLSAWQDVFSEHVLSAKRCLPLDRESDAHQRLRGLAAMTAGAPRDEAAPGTGSPARAQAENWA